MKSKYLLVIVLCLSITTLVLGQRKHEIKFDISGAFSKNYVPNYELVLSKKIGIETALGFDLSNIYLFDINSVNFEQHEFSASQFNPSIGGKYYFLFNKKKGSGLFVGPYFRANFSLDREEGYAMKWEELFNRVASERVRTNNGIKSLHYGLHGGFKWLIKSNFIVEFAITWTADKLVGKGASEFKDISSASGDGFLKVGYRF